jgi:hypothetical protein
MTKEERKEAMITAYKIKQKYSNKSNYSLNEFVVLACAFMSALQAQVEDLQDENVVLRAKLDSMDQPVPFGWSSKN